MLLSRYLPSRFSVRSKSLSALLAFRSERSDSAECDMAMSRLHRGHRTVAPSRLISLRKLRLRHKARFS